MTTATRILRAAAAEFADHGVAGARVDRIAAAAHANKERLYHYFGDKDALFDAALDDAMRQIAEAEPFEADDLGAYVGAMVDFHRRHPHLIRLLLAEGAHRGAAPASRPGRLDHYVRRVAAVRRAQEHGSIRAEVDPRLVVYAVLALVVTAEALPGLTGLILAADPQAPALGSDDFRAGLQALISALLQPARGRPSERRPRSNG